MKINDIEDMTGMALQFEISRGGKFVIYKYCISALVITFRRTSDVYFIPSGGSGFKYAAQYTLISLLLGWWGLPWGIIYTFDSLFTNLGGGKDVTADVLAILSSNTSKTSNPQATSGY